MKIRRLGKMIDKSKLYDTPIDHVKFIPSRFIDFNFTERTGRGSFKVELYPEDAERLKKAGWNVSEYKNPNYPDSDVRYSINIVVKFRGTGEDSTPYVFVAEGRTRRRLYQDTVYNNLKDARFSDAHIVINPYFYDQSDPTKFSAYASEVTFDLDTNSPKPERHFNNRYGSMYDDK